MPTLHIVPGDSAGGSVQRAVRDAGRGDEVLRFLDDLSCGPIVSEDRAERAEWWAKLYDERDIEARLCAFWDRVTANEDRLIVWVGRHRASELAFFLAWAERLGDRPFHYIDVTGRRFARRNNPTELGPPMQSVGIMNPDMLRSLLDTKKPMTRKLREDASRRWRQLKVENAPFRIVTAVGMESASEDYFDPLILKQATTEWRPAVRIIAETIGYNSEPYIQVGDVMLHVRVVALVDQGKLLADGDPWDRRACRVRRLLRQKPYSISKIPDRYRSRDIAQMSRANGRNPGR